MLAIPTTAVCVFVLILLSVAHGVLHASVTCSDPARWLRFLYWYSGVLFASLFVYLVLYRKFVLRLEKRLLERRGWVSHTSIGLYDFLHAFIQIATLAIALLRFKEFYDNRCEKVFHASGPVYETAYISATIALLMHTITSAVSVSVLVFDRRHWLDLRASLMCLCAAALGSLQPGTRGEHAPRSPESAWAEAMQITKDLTPSPPLTPQRGRRATTAM